jgi:hypothetical protein
LICFAAKSSSSFTIDNQLFLAYPAINYWKVSISSITNKLAGSSSLVFKINKLPSGGQCSVSPLIGYAKITDFTFVCSNWYDPNGGSISRYEFYSNFFIIHLFLIASQ